MRTDVRESRIPREYTRRHAELDLRFTKAVVG